MHSLSNGLYFNLKFVLCILFSNSSFADVARVRYGVRCGWTCGMGPAVAHFPVHALHKAPDVARCHVTAILHTTSTYSTLHVP